MSALVILIAAACTDASQADSSTRDADGDIVESGEVGAFRLQVGDCVTGVATGEVSSLTGVPCTAEHELEVFHSFDLLGNDYPGEDAVIEQAQTGCFGMFDSFVGLSYAESVYDFTTLYPTAESWDQIDDREVLCLIGNLDGSMKTGTAAGTAI